MIGEGHPERYEQTQGVHVRGFVDDIVTEYTKADLYVHPARRDAFGVSVAEAMLAGTVPVVTTTTGAREEVARLDRDLVTEPTPDSIAESVRTALRANEQKQDSWRADAREQAAEYSEEQKTGEFEDQFATLVCAIQ